MMGELRIMDRKKGDTKTVWDKNDEDQVAAAKKQFDDLTKKGYLAYTVRRDGKPGRKMNTFDPDAEAVILAPPVVGG